jgi:hypothetical protein
MCRNIRPLFNFAPPATPEEIRAAALQYVRKVSGSRAPTGNNTRAFEQAVKLIAEVTQELVNSLETQSPPKSREVEALKARTRNARRFG